MRLSRIVFALLLCATALMAYLTIPKMIARREPVPVMPAIVGQQAPPQPEPTPVTPVATSTTKNHCSPVLSGQIKANPTFLDVAQAGCEKNPYIGKTVKWTAKISDYAHTGGIRFWVVDKDHPTLDRDKHGLFWGTFLGSSAEDPRQTDEGLQKWDTKWVGSWLNYIMEIYGHIDYTKTKADKFLVTAVVDYVDCAVIYDGCYIETTIKKIEVVKN